MEIDAGRWRARLTDRDGADGALQLRAQAFRGGASDEDAFDRHVRHLVVEGPEGVVACARVDAQRRADIARGYTAQVYDLSAFARCFPRALEVGRICLNGRCQDPDVPRLLLAMLARVVATERLAVLYGCASFPLASAGLAKLRSRVAPPAWAPGRKAPETCALVGDGGAMPPLLRSYLGLGARVSDHGVIDRDLRTVHVFTGLPIADIPPARARLLTGMLVPA